MRGKESIVRGVSRAVLQTGGQCLEPRSRFPQVLPHYLTFREEYRDIG